MGRKSDRFRSLDPGKANFLDSMFSSEEIKSAVWDCGLDRPLGLDGLSFRFLRHFWVMMWWILCRNFVSILGFPLGVILLLLH